jgi:3,4-dihydroxy 2-butanone 4-phosphate synthase/GTP cyclohydrolase II
LGLIVKTPNMDTSTINTIKLDSIAEAIEDIKNGKVVIVVDDEDRENEGDFICAAELITPEIINFMSKYGRGLICTPITEERAIELNLRMMVNENTDMHGTAFTVSIDYKKKGCTTGISAYDRATGIKAITAEDTKPTDFARPGHIFPLIAKKGGVLKRTGHTEAAIDLAMMAGLHPTGVLVEILNEDGSMARLPQLKVIAEHFDLKLISIKDLVAYRMQKERLVKESNRLTLPELDGFEMVTFEEENEHLVHIALKYGKWNDDETVMVRVHSSNNAKDVLYNLTHESKFSFNNTIDAIKKDGKGVLLMMRKKEDENSMKEAIKRLTEKLQSKTHELEESDQAAHVQRELGIGAQILFELGVRRIKLLTNSPRRRVGLIGYGLEIVENIVI